MSGFTFSTTGTIAVRDGASNEIAALAGAKLGRRILLTTDPGLRKAGLVEPAINALRGEGYSVTVFDEVEPDPSLQTLMSAVDQGRAAGVTGVIGFGGGSSLDVAKLTALLLGSSEDLEAAWGVNKVAGPRLPLVLVPTTSGTGSEVTPVSIISVANSEKRGVSSPVILPDMAILDVGLTLSLPRAITAYTGIDAIVHAIEAFTSASPNNNPISRMLAKEAVRLLCGHIERACADGADKEAREAMLLGSMLAGQAFGNSPVAAVHALAYPIGGLYHVPHGLSNSLVLAQVMKFNLRAAAPAYAEIAAAAFPSLAVGSSESRASDFIEKLEALVTNLGIPSRLRDVGIAENAIDRLAESAMLQQRLLINNPRPVMVSDAAGIYRDAW